MRTLAKVIFLIIALATGVVSTTLGITANFTPATYNPNVGESLLFNVIRPVVERGSATYEWDFDGDGAYEISTGDELIRHTFDEPGHHNITLRVTATDGRRVTRMKEILVGASPLYAIRTATTIEHGAISVLITIVAREWIKAPGFVEKLPVGFKAKPVEPGEAMGAKINTSNNSLEVLFSEIAEGEERSFRYRLYPLTEAEAGCPVLNGLVSGYGTNGRIEAQICGDLSQY
ncbi:MAG: PKD domain-containing protein [Candidatus Bipolaricaulota bacterium]|nr:PKD domain-containing protein [Candidatus Bipolaricaulota bacterium]